MKTDTTVTKIPAQEVREYVVIFTQAEAAALYNFLEFAARPGWVNRSRTTVTLDNAANKATALRGLIDYLKSEFDRSDVTAFGEAY